ncbi:Undecaprenyl phosphate N,N'-diacetylbacillosamine 1-phosphate transferase [anaerobic digester metagenome]
MYRYFLKRLFDLVFSILALIILLPLLIIVALLLIISNRRFDPIFLQPRPGKNERIFKVLKFKTMSDKRDESGLLLPDSDRLTKVGKLIRKLSIDELPQLINIIKGDMSFIGPRPLMVKYLKLYTPKQARRHEVRPGITGWAQVNGRNKISWAKKFELDVWYVENLSFSLDMKILMLTVKKVLIRDGISKDGFATTEAFNGNN